MRFATEEEKEAVRGLGRDADISGPIAVHNAVGCSAEGVGDDGADVVQNAVRKTISCGENDGRGGETRSAATHALSAVTIRRRRRTAVAARSDHVVLCAVAPVACVRLRLCLGVFAN